MKRFFAPLCVALLATAVRAAPAPGWAVDKVASSVRFSSSLNGAAFSGAFRRWDADIRFDPANLAGSSVTASFETASAATGDADRDQALPTAVFLSAAQFPRATFAAHAFKALGAGRYQAIGTLTLRGATKPLTLPFTLAITGPQARMNATVALNRLAFGVGQNEWKATGNLPAVVTVTIALTARRKS
ncbi:MAG: YceI family protein [Caulobacteraceae bacterium]|nr:YceI family protein [Caulobacteraceae bacterium]